MRIEQFIRQIEQQLAFKGAKSDQTWFGQVTFRKETEPYMSMAVRSKGEAGAVTVADVNLKFIWGVVTRIKIGKKGKAYVVDGSGHLVADPDIGLVLRKTDLSQLPQITLALTKRFVELHGGTILIVEDNQKNMKLARDVLQSKGYLTLEAVTGEDGVRMAIEKKPDRRLHCLGDVKRPQPDLRRRVRRFSQQTDQPQEIPRDGEAPARKQTCMSVPAKILVVDDTPANVKLLSDLLASRGYQVFTAVNGEEALVKVAAEKPDLVLLDVMMPGLSGYDVCRRIRADPATALLPVVMCTSLDPQQERVKGIEAGADDFLSKPVNQPELFARVKSSLRVKALHDELAALNANLEKRVAEQVGEIERLARLKRFVSPRVGDLILAGEVDDPLKTHRREITVVFTDLRGFTSPRACAARQAPARC